MSTTIINMEGKVWDKEDNSPINQKTLKQQLSLTRFYGGKQFKGRAIQLTIGAGEYICLSKKECHQLAYTLLDSFDDDIYPSE
jgi:hypothetical protein